MGRHRSPRHLISSGTVGAVRVTAEEGLVVASIGDGRERLVLTRGQAEAWSNGLRSVSAVGCDGIDELCELLSGAAQASRDDAATSSTGPGATEPEPPERQERGSGWALKNGQERETERARRAAHHRKG